jgi:hypothetical protein
MAPHRPASGSRRASLAARPARAGGSAHGGAQACSRRGCAHVPGASEYCTLVGGASDVDSDGDASPPNAEPERGFPCDEPGCVHVTARAGNLKRHKRTHRGERPHACDEPGCEYRAAQASHLKAHKRTHSRARRTLEMEDFAAPSDDMFAEGGALFVAAQPLGLARPDSLAILPIEQPISLAAAHPLCLAAQGSLAKKHVAPPPRVHPGVPGSGSGSGSGAVAAVAVAVAAVKKKAAPKQTAVKALGRRIIRVYSRQGRQADAREGRRGRVIQLSTGLYYYF